VTTADAQRWLDGLKVASQTAKNFRTTLGTLFAFGESRGYISRGQNPVEAAHKIKVRSGSVEIFTPAEIERLLRAASPGFLPCLAIGAFAGPRSAEFAPRMERRCSCGQAYRGRGAQGHNSFPSGGAHRRQPRAWLAP
jgi:hypothetical protein